MAWIEKHGGAFRIRYRLDDGTLVSETGFDTKTAAQDRADEVASEQRRGTLTDPRAGQMLLRDWATVCTEAHDVTEGTAAKNQSHLRNHILPKFGDTPLAEVRRMVVKAWVKTLRRRLADSTVADVVSLLSMMLGEAVEEGLIGANPCRKLRTNPTGVERPHAQPGQVSGIADRCAPSDRALIITAAYTGMRWGELTGLQWANLDLAAATIVIDPDEGALHEVGGRLTLGPPKTAASARMVHLPPFLAALLGQHRDNQDHRFVFTGADGGLLRRSNFRRRVWLPAVQGDPTKDWCRSSPGSTFTTCATPTRPG